MQKIKAHELRTQDEKMLLDRLTDLRVRWISKYFPWSFIFIFSKVLINFPLIERAQPTQSQQGRCCSPSQVG